MKQTLQQRLFTFYEHNGGYAEMSGDSPHPYFVGTPLRAGIVARNEDELQEICEILQELKIDHGSSISGQGKLVQPISGEESIRLFKKVIDEIANLYVFNVPETFGILDFNAELDFKTESSASFRLVTVEDMPATETRIVVQNATIWFGWIDVHFIANGCVKIQIRAGVHEKYERYRTCGNLEEIVQSVFRAFGIPVDETYEIRFIVEKQILMGFQYQDRWGNSSVIVD